MNLCRAIFTLLVSLLAAFAHARAQHDPDVVVFKAPSVLSLQATADSGMSETWAVVSAELRERQVSTWGVLAVRNLSRRSITEARFFAEYYDASGIRRLALAFSLGENFDDDRRPLGPGEVRELLASAGSLTPMTKPVAVRLRLISQQFVGAPVEAASGDAIVQAPAVIRGGVPSQGVDLDIASLLDGPPLADLLFAEVTIGPDGKPQNVNIINDLGQTSLREWVHGLMNSPGFSPAESGFKPVQGVSLLLVRAFIHPDSVVEWPFARDSLWVKEFVSKSRGAKLPPIAQIFLFPESKMRPLGPVTTPRAKVRMNPNLYTPISVGDDWCPNVFKWKLDSNSRRMIRRWNTDQDSKQQPNH